MGALFSQTRKVELKSNLMNDEIYYIVNPDMISAHLDGEEAELEDLWYLKSAKYLRMVCLAIVLFL